MDIVATVLKYFSPALLNRMAVSIGVEPGVMEKLVTGGVPAILSGILGKTTQPGGAKILGDVIARQSSNVLDNLTEAVGNARQVPLVDEGRQAIGTLLGTGALGQLAGTLSKFGSTGIGNASTVLGLVMPGVLGVLGREQKTRGLDAAGLANMLSGQRDIISDAIPKDLRGLLADTALLDNNERRAAPQRRDGEVEVIGRLGQTAAPLATPSAPASVQIDEPDDHAPASTPRHVPAPNGHFSWPGWLAAIAAAAVMWWSVFGERAIAIATGNPMPDIQRAVSMSPAMMVGSADVASDTIDTLNLLHATLTGIRGETTAKLSLPKLQESAGEIDRLRALSGQLAPDMRKRFSGLVTARSDEMKAALAAAQAAPGAGTIVRPVIEQLRTRLDALAKSPGN